MDGLPPHNIQLLKPTNTDFGTEHGLQHSVRDYIAEAFADSTRRSYRSDLEHFYAWGGTIPTSPDVVAQYLAYHGGALSAATLGRRLVAIGRAHTRQGMANPCATDVVRATFRGIRRTHGTAQRQAKPLLIADLVLILDRLGTRPKDLRDRALLLVGFAGALRRSELVGLNVADVEDAPQGLIFRIRRSKTDQESQGRKIGVPFGRGRHCPVEAVREWLSSAQITDGPLFRPVDRHGHISSHRLSTQAISEIVKSRVASIGHNPIEYSGHSLRAGLITSAAIAGLPTWQIKKQSGHASDGMLHRYIRVGEIFRGNVVASLL